MLSRGLDISKFNAGIDFTDVVEQGFKFVIIRGGYTGSRESKPQAKDKYFETFYQQAKAQKLGVGAYWFSRATSKAEGEKEAQYFYENCLKGKQFEYPVCIDVEDKKYQAEATATQVTDGIIGFCEYLENKGYYVCWYSYPNFIDENIEVDRLVNYDLWLAHWVSKPTQKYTYGIWQFSGSKNGAEIAGSKQKCDQNIAFKNYPRIMLKNGLNGFESSDVVVDDEVINKADEIYKIPDTQITWDTEGVKMSEKVYNVLKALCTVVLPAIGACYVAIAKIWNLPYATEIVGTLSAVCTLIGALLGLDSKQYWQDKEIVEKVANDNE